MSPRGGSKAVADHADLDLGADAPELPDTAASRLISGPIALTRPAPSVFGSMMTDFLNQEHRKEAGLPVGDHPKWVFRAVESPLAS